MTHILSDSYLQQFNSNKMPIHSESFNGNTNTNNHHHHHAHHHSSFSSSTNKFTGLVDTSPSSSSINLDNFNKRYATEDTMIDVLKSLYNLSIYLTLYEVEITIVSSLLLQQI